jgi:hypothetical protein
LAATIALGAIGWPGRDYLQGDFFQFYAGAKAVVSHTSPYDVGWTVGFAQEQGSRVLNAPPHPSAGDPRWTTAYPMPLFILIVPLALLPFPAAAAAWLVGQLVVVGIALWSVGRAALRAPQRDGAVLAGIALSFQPLWLLFSNGNLTGFLFGVAAAAFVALLRGQAFAAGAILALAVAKPQSFAVYGLALLFATPRLARPAFIAGASVVAIALVAASFVVRPDWVAGWLAAVAALQSTSFSNATGWTIARPIPGAPEALGPLAVIAAAAFFVGWAIRARPSPTWMIAAAVPVSVFVAPHGWTYEQLYLLIPAAIVIDAVADAAPRVRTYFLVSLAAVFVLLPWTLYTWDLTHNGEEVSALVPLAVLALVLAARRVRAGGQSRPEGVIGARAAPPTYPEAP